MENKKYLNSAEVCTMLRISRYHLFKLRTTNYQNFNHLVVNKVGERKYVYDQEALEQWMKNINTNG